MAFEISPAAAPSASTTSSSNSSSSGCGSSTAGTAGTTNTITATSTAAAPARPIFEPDGDSVQATEVRDKTSPGRTSLALARFEFEPGRGNQGTKILMIEWEDDAYTRSTPGQWHVSWEHKASTVLPARDQPRQGGAHRMYFLLLPGVRVPPVVTLTHKPTTATTATTAPTSNNTSITNITNITNNITNNNHATISSNSSSSYATVPISNALLSSSVRDGDNSSSGVNALAASLDDAAPPQQQQQQQQPSAPRKTVWRINPLPAIFPPELGASARAHGKKGVLHTLWAKKRLVELQREIHAESATNAEGVGLEMALQEKEWIEQNFGVLARPLGGVSIVSAAGLAAAADDGAPTSPLSPGGFGGGMGGPSSPRTPGGGNRLAEKLKGLRVGTSEKDLNGRQGSTGGDKSNNPLSPETSDVAISSFAALHGPVGRLGGRGNAGTALRQSQSQPASAVAAAAAPLSSTNGSHGSYAANGLNGTQNGQPRPPPPASAAASSTARPSAALTSTNRVNGSSGSGSGGDEDNDLFAVAISPRSPDMVKSPFSLLSRVSQSMNGSSGGAPAATTSTTTTTPASVKLAT